MRHATIHIVYYSNSPNEACHYSNTSNEACHCAHCHHQVTVVTTVTGQGCKTYVRRRRSIRGWFTRVFDLHHHLVYRGALSHIQWNVVFTFQRDYNHTVCECLVLINVCECLVLINIFGAHDTSNPHWTSTFRRHNGRVLHHRVDQDAGVNVDHGKDRPLESIVRPFPRQSRVFPVYD